MDDQNQEELQENRKKEARNQKKLKSKKKALATKFRSQKEAAAKITFRCEKISQPSGAAAKAALRLLRKPSLAHECHFVAGYHRFAAGNWLRFFPRLESHRFAAKASFRRVFRSCKTLIWHTSASSQSHTPVSQLQNGLRN